ncbi:hypothetical protein PQ478_09340 [Alkalihalophilus pseudofirmus]|uniref:hypothetical protein n=1 Tax=Alkalihalophilus pseudofirmus TaxID=79885 RepID=UPI00259B6F72|nr:hypothetical protein [Alkalihalophilus pseudofirmus]WEG18671.1 hypothetical protein PQ478_09340 [Alkalihalophilus pseudofirmus]
MRNHKAIFKQSHKKYDYIVKHRKLDSFDASGLPRLIECTPFIEALIVDDLDKPYSLITECDLDKPELEIGDEIFVNELNKLGEVEEKHRTTGNEIIYYLHIYGADPDQNLEGKEKAKQELIETTKEYEQRLAQEKLEEGGKDKVESNTDTDFNNTTETIKPNKSLFTRIKELFQWKED